MKNFFKRFAALAMGTLLLANAAACALAEAPQGTRDANLLVNVMEYNVEESQRSKEPTGAVAVGETLYMLTNRTLEKWTEGMAEPQVVLSQLPLRAAASGDEPVETLPQEPKAEEPEAETTADQEAAAASQPAADQEAADTKANEGTQEEPEAQATAEPLYFGNNVFTDGARVLALDTNTGEVWQLADGTEGFAPSVAVKLDWQGMLTESEGYSYFGKQTLDLDVVDGTLYMPAMDYSEGGEPATSIFRWELATGKALPPIEKTLVQSLTAYQNGQFLCVLFDQMNGWDQEAQKMKPTQLGTLDVAQGTVTPLFDIVGDNVCGLSYEPQTDTIYYTAGSAVYSLAALKPEAKISAYLPIRAWSGTSMGLLSKDLYYSASYEGVVVRELNVEKAAQGVLVVMGQDSRLHNHFLVDHPETRVSLSDQYFDTLEKFAQSMVSGETAVDVFSLSSTYAPLDRLIQKGYAMDLSGSAKLMETVKEMYPSMAEPCMRDGKLYALPMGTDAWGLAYNVDVLEELELTQADVPKSFSEFLDFAQNWEADFGEDHPEINFMDDPNWRYSLMGLLDEWYYAYLKQQGQPISFDTELYRKLIKKIDAIEAPLDVNTMDQEDQEEYWNRKTLFMRGMPHTYFYEGQEQKNLVLPLDEGLEPVLPMNLTVLIVNARTTHPQEALQYMETMTQYYDEQNSNITLFPEHNEPVINRSFEQDVEWWKKQKASTEEALKTAAPEQISNLKADVERLEELIQNADKYRYVVSGESIAAYRKDVAPYLYATGQMPFQIWSSDGKNEFEDLKNQYLDGAISSDQYMGEMSKRLRMIDLENQ